MGRLSTLDEPKIFAAVGRNMTRSGSVTFRELVHETGVSVGSLYHRFESREGLMAEAWLDALLLFHQFFLQALETGGPDSGLNAALATPNFCRQQQNRATLLACCRPSEFLSEGAPVTVSRQIRQANEKVEKAVRRFARQQGLTLQCCRLGLVAMPLGAVRMYLPAKRVPASVDGYVAAAYNAITSLGGVK